MEKLVCIVIQIFGIIINHSFGQNQGAAQTVEFEKQCKNEIFVRLSVQNKICGTISPPYNATYLVPNVPDGSTLFDVMTQAAPLGFTFQYTSDPKFGAFITTVNGLEANNTLRQFWALWEGWTGVFLPLGASSYKPKLGENIVFLLSLY